MRVNPTCAELGHADLGGGVCGWCGEGVSQEPVARFRRGLDRHGGWWVVEVNGRAIGKARRVRSGSDPVWEARLFPDGRQVYRPGVGIRSRAEAAEALAAEAAR